MHSRVLVSLAMLTDQEIGVAPGPRLELTPYRKQRRVATAAS